MGLLRGVDLEAAGEEVRIAVGHPGGTYDIVLEAGALGRIGEIAGGLGLGSRVVVATDANVAPLHGESTVGALRGAGFDAQLVVIEAGEQAKSWATLDMLV